MQKNTLNTQARRLRTAIEASLRTPVSHSQAQHLIAQAHGHANWQTARAQVKESAAPPRWVITRTEDDEVSHWLLDGTEADAQLWVMTLVLPYALEHLGDEDEAGSLLRAYRERDWVTFMELFSVATSGDVTYFVARLPEEVEPAPVALTGEALAALLAKHHPVEDGSAPEAFTCECGENVQRGDSFYEDDAGQWCMDCGMDRQDGLHDDQNDPGEVAVVPDDETYLSSVVMTFLQQASRGGAALTAQGDLIGTQPVRAHYNPTHLLLNVLHDGGAQNYTLRGARVTGQQLTLFTTSGTLTLRAERDAQVVQAGGHFAPGDQVYFKGNTSRTYTVGAVSGNVITTVSPETLLAVKDVTLAALASASDEPRGFLPGDRVTFGDRTERRVTRVKAHHLAPLVTLDDGPGEIWADDPRLRLATREVTLSGEQTPWPVLLSFTVRGDTAAHVAAGLTRIAVDARQGLALTNTEAGSWAAGAFTTLHGVTRAAAQTHAQALYARTRAPEQGGLLLVTVLAQDDLALALGLTRLAGTLQATGTLDAQGESGPGWDVVLAEYSAAD